MRANISIYEVGSAKVEMKQFDSHIWLRLGTSEATIDMHFEPHDFDRVKAIADAFNGVTDENADTHSNL